MTSLEDLTWDRSLGRGYPVYYKKRVIGTLNTPREQLFTNIVDARNKDRHNLVKRVLVGAIIVLAIVWALITF